MFHKKLSYVMLGNVRSFLKYTASIKLQLMMFAAIELDQTGNIKLAYLERENGSIVWPSKCNCNST